MIIKAHGSLGDEVMLTGLPEAYNKITGQFIGITTNRHYLWENNPYIKDSSREEFSYAFNVYPKDYLIYYPIRLFFDLTGFIVDRNLVQPNLYKPRVENNEKIIVVNDEAGWPSRRGYPYFNTLCKDLKDLGYAIYYTRGNTLDCMGHQSEKTITNYTYNDNGGTPNLVQVIDLLQRAAFYIGYDSGLAQLAGALKVPYVLLSLAIPPINTAHNSCIYALDTCKHDCQEHSKYLHVDKNREIVERIGSFEKWNFRYAYPR